MNSHTRPESHLESALALLLENTQVILAESRRDSGFLRRGQTNFRKVQRGLWILPKSFCFGIRMQELHSFYREL